jgi:hypothetical protein
MYLKLMCNQCYQLRGRQEFALDRLDDLRTISIILQEPILVTISISMYGSNDTSIYSRTIERNEV